MASVEVFGHYDNGIGTSNAASQGVVDGRLLRDIPLLRPGEALEAVPGLVVTQHSGDGKANQYFLRGYNLDHGTDFAASVDSVPVNMPTHAHGQGYADLNFLIPELVERIDYRKGPYYAENGDFSAAGSADIHYLDRLDRGIAQFTFGSHAYQRVLLADSTTLGTAASAGAPTLLGALELQNANGPWALPEGLRKINLLLRLSGGDAAQGWSVDAIHYQAHWNSTDQVPLALIQSGQLGRYSALDPTDGGKTGRDVLSGEWHASDASGYLLASAYLEHYRLKLWSDFTFDELRQGLAPDPNAFSDQFEQRDNRNLVGGRLARGWTHTLWGNDSTLEAGLQARHDNIDVALLNTQARVPFGTVSDDRVSETSAGLYVQESTNWQPWFNTVVGLREDLISMDMTAHGVPQNSGSASASQLSPKLAIVLGPWAKTEFFIDAGRGFHSNDARGVIDRIDPTQPGVAADRVPVLASAVGKEVGVRTEIVPGLQSSLSLWSLNSQSEIIYAADSAIGSTEPEGASRRYGVEWNNHYALGRWLLLDADLAWTHARYASSHANGEAGSQIPNAMPKVARLGATVHDLGPWSASLELRYFSAYPLNQDNSLRTPSAVVTNLRLTRQITPDMAVSLDILNALDRKYYDIAYEQDYRVSPTSPVVPGGVTVHPGEPREFRLSLLFRL